MLTAILFIRLSAYLHRTGKLPSGRRGRLEDIEIKMTIAPSPGLSDLFDNNEPASDSQKVRETGHSDESACHESILPRILSKGLSDTGNKAIAELVRIGVLVPRLGSEFWQVYGNKLRAFGTDAQFMEVGMDTAKTDESK